MVCQCLRASSRCIGREAAFWAAGWMDWKSKMYCEDCILEWGWREKAEEKAELDRIQAEEEKLRAAAKAAREKKAAQDKTAAEKKVAHEKAAASKSPAVVIILALSRCYPHYPYCPCCLAKTM